MDVATTRRRSTRRFVVMVSIALALTSGMAACSDSAGSGSPAPNSPGALTPRSPSSEAPETEPQNAEGILNPGGIEQALPRADELPAGWKLERDDFNPWPGGDIAPIAAGPNLCEDWQKATEPVDTEYGKISSVGNGTSEGAVFNIDVVGSTGRGEATLPERIENAKRNSDLRRSLYACVDPKELSGVGDDALSFENQGLAHVIMRVGSVEVVVSTPVAQRPNAEAWARVMDQRIRSVMTGKAPTARIAS
ncbi:hypothetical protein ACFV0D_40555 [Streptomyces sp. NPDC059556]|uniref:hypothetical protein n=1 Tax=Streptomyces sp. NPDC059556 TaxID=3346863 RepID=UPI00369C6894